MDLTLQAPPRDLRAITIDLARSRRAPGQSLHRVDELTSVEAFRRTVTLLDALVGSLTPEEWEAPTVEGWTVKDLLAHVVAVEAYFGHQLGLWPFDVEAVLEHDHLEMTRPFVAQWADRSPGDVLDRWRELSSATTAHVASLPREAMRRRVRFHYLDTALSTILISRVFELWTHDEDICRATGRPVRAPDAARLRRMSRVAVPSLPFGLALAGQDMAGRTARIVLTGPGGGTWDQALAVGGTPGASDVTLIVDVVDYCRLAARRVSPADVAVLVEGDADLASAVLAGAGVFAA